MGANFGPFFDQADRQVVAFFRSQLLQSNRRGEAGWASSNDNDVKFHEFALHINLLKKVGGEITPTPKGTTEKKVRRPRSHQLNAEVSFGMISNKSPTSP